MDNPAIAHVAVGWVFKYLILLLVLFFTFHTHGQCLPTQMPFNTGETVEYDIYFKWGVLMPRAGGGKISFQTSSSGKAKFKYNLTFQTSKFFDAIYKMRDTLNCFYGQDYRLLHSSIKKREGGKYSIDELKFSHTGGKTSIHSKRYTAEQVKIDTVLTVSSGCVTDMLGATFRLRTLNWDDMQIGKEFSSTVVVGSDLVKVTFRYQGQSVVERGEVKYRTHYFVIDIFDEVFEQTKAAAEIWIGDDENRIPIKVRTKLKIGHAEVYYKSSTNLKAPLTCKVDIKR